MIYPNPTENLINIPINGTEIIRIGGFDMLGRDVSDRIKIVSRNDEALILDLSGLMEGNYIIQLIDQIASTYDFRVTVE